MDYYQLLKTDYTWQNLSINEIHKILYGESSKKISGYDNSNGCNVIVFGPPQIGKTTLILYLLGIDENYKYKESTDDLSTLLRAGIIAGSSTSTAITYKRSNDEYIYIDGEKLTTASDVVNKLKKVRISVESNKYDKKILEIEFPNTAFKYSIADLNSSYLYLDGKKLEEYINLLKEKDYSIHKSTDEFIHVNNITIDSVQKFREMIELHDLNNPVVVDFPLQSFIFDKFELSKNLKLIDMPGYGSKNLNEEPHVKSIYEEQLRFANVVLIVVEGNSVESLAHLKEESNELIQNNWYLYKNYFVVTTKSMTAEKVISDYKKVQNISPFYDFIKQYYQEIMHSIFGNQNISIFNFDIGDTFSEFIKKVDFYDSTNEKMTKSLFEKMKEFESKKFSLLINNIKSEIEHRFSLQIMILKEEIEKEKKSIEKRKKNIKTNNSYLNKNDKLLNSQKKELDDIISFRDQIVINFKPIEDKLKNTESSLNEYILKFHLTSNKVEHIRSQISELEEFICLNCWEIDKFSEPEVIDLADSLERYLREAIKLFRRDKTKTTVSSKFERKNKKKFFKTILKPEINEFYSEFIQFIDEKKKEYFDNKISFFNNRTAEYQNITERFSDTNQRLENKNSEESLYLQSQEENLAILEKQLETKKKFLQDYIKIAKKSFNTVNMTLINGINTTNDTHLRMQLFLKLCYQKFEYLQLEKEYYGR